MESTQLTILRILAKTVKYKKPRKRAFKTVYPKNIERVYKRTISGFFKPLVEYVNKYIRENHEALLRGDSSRMDIMVGATYERMIESLNKWVAIQMPTEATDGSVIMDKIERIAESEYNHAQKQFWDEVEKAIGINFPSDADWWEKVKTSWAVNNYDLIVTNARHYITQINTVTEQAVTGGWSVSQLQAQINKFGSDLTEKKARLLARDQIGKLQGQISEAQMESVGLEMYIWETAGDERVRKSHRVMQGLLCRWDNANVYSLDNGRTWIERPSGAVRLHPGQDIQCRCVSLVFAPELDNVVNDTPIPEE